MFIPISFFKKYIDIEDKEVIISTLLKIGIEVENVYEVGNDLDNIKIGKVVEKSKHPNADKIWICKIDFYNEWLQILTADESVEIGDIVLVALPGCILPNGLKIDIKNIRGIESYGMMLSSKELGWENIKTHGQGVSKFNFDKKLTQNIGKFLKDVIKTKDYVIEIKALANKVESLSVYHLSREIAFILNIPFLDPFTGVNYQKILKNEVNNEMEIDIISENCKYYKAIFLDNVKINYSPVEFQLILNWMNTKPVNNLVDITNFLMYELAQPLHAFDKKDIDEKIVIRQARKGEILEALDGKNYELEIEDLVISDSKNKVLALAGIIGSRNYSIKDNTNSVVIEIANFLPISIRKTSKRLGLYTNSSRRFEKSIPAIYVDYAQKRLISLINDFSIECEVKGVISKGQIEPPKIISFDLEKINNYIGIDFNIKQVLNFLNIFSVDYNIKNEKIIEIKTYRNDINSWWDVAEELCRFKGFSNIVEEALKIDYPEKVYVFDNTTIFKEKILYNIEKIKEKLVNNGYFEVVGYNLLNPQYLEIFGKSFLSIDNFMSVEHSAYRNSILPSILKIATENYKAGYKNLKIFEIGKVFNEKEYYQLGILVYSDTKSFIYDQKSYILNEVHRIKNILGNVNLKSTTDYKFLNKGYEIFLQEEKIGFIGILNHFLLKHFSYPPYTLVANIDLEKFFSILSKNEKERYDRKMDISFYPPIYKDISFYVDSEWDYNKLLQTILNVFKENFKESLVISNFYLLDIYEMDGAVSYTFRIELKPNTEVTNEDLNKVMNIIFEVLAKEGIHRRG